MQLMVRVRVKHDKLDKVIAALPSSASYATELAADAVVSKAKSLVPVRTGALRDSITKAGGGASWIVTATQHYAAFVEFGTRFMSARPYLRPAIESLNWGDFIRAFFKRLGL